jgi:hypothetical protein
MLMLEMNKWDVKGTQSASFEKEEYVLSPRRTCGAR